MTILLLIVLGALAPGVAMFAVVFYWANQAISDEEMEFLENVRPERFTAIS